MKKVVHHAAAGSPTKILSICIGTNFFSGMKKVVHHATATADSPIKMVKQWKHTSISSFLPKVTYVTIAWNVSAATNSIVIASVMVSRWLASLSRDSDTNFFLSL